MTARVAYDTTTKVTIEALFCSTCGVAFGLAADYMAQRRDDHVGFHCPNKHPQYYPQETDAEKYKRELKQERDRATRLTAERDQLEASRRAWKGQATKARNRAVAGECPICGTHVYQLGRHMARKHPDEQPTADGA